MSPRSVCAGAWLFGLLFGLTLLIHLTQGLDLGALAAQCARVPTWAWLVTALAWHGAMLVQAWRLQSEWISVRRLSLGRCWRLSANHGLVARLLPLRLGDVSHAWMVHREWPVSLSRAARSLYWMRWQDATTLTALTVLLLTPLPAAGRCAGFALVLLVGSVLLPQQVLRLTRGHAGWRRWNLGALQLGRRMHGWVGSGCSAALRLSGVAVLMHQLNPTQSGALAHTTLGIELSAWLPVQGPAGLGTYEAGAWLGAKLGGGDPPRFVAAALVAHAFGIVLAASAVVAARLVTVETTTGMHPAT